jgi:two-component system OmpR family response regulator
MVHILVAEDNTNLGILLQAKLSQAGYKVFLAEDGQAALDFLDREHIDLVISDILMPRVDGYELIEAIRSTDWRMPILILSAKEQFDDKKKGFQLGIDDYIVKPVNLKELLLRVEALLRRAHIARDHKIAWGDFAADADSLTITIAGEVQQLPKKEFLLLFKLLQYPKQIFTRQQIMDEIWGMDSETDERTVDNHIKRLRRRLGE